MGGLYWTEDGFVCGKLAIIPYQLRVDNSLWTTIMCYTVMFIYLGAGAILSYCHYHHSLTWMSFMSFGFGFGLLALSHQIGQTREDWTYAIIYPVGLGIILQGIALAMLISLRFSTMHLRKQSPRKIMLTRIWFVSNIIAALAAVVTSSQFVVCLWAAISFIIMTVISGHLYLNTRLIFNLLKSCGLMLNLVGFTLYLSMNHRCGFYAYNDCLRHCLLPSPLRFNHMALLGIFLSLGGICYGVGELMECTEALIVSIDVDETVCDEDDLSTMDLDENNHTGDQQVDEEIGDAIQPQDEQNELNDKLQVVEDKINKQKQQEHLDSRSDESDEEQPDDITLQMTSSSD